MALNSYVLKVLVEKQTNRVALAESGADFVLLLLRLFALPLSTIVKLVGKQAPIGCLSLLYESIETLEAEQFNTEACKTMLLRPKCVSRAAARDLKVNIEEGNSATTFYVCEKPKCSIEGHRTISTIMGAICPCGGVMNTLIESEISKDGSTDLKDIEKVFANETCRFMISDDLKVRAISTFEGFSFLDDLGIRDTKHLEERTVKMGTDQVVRLVKCVLLSKTPLTDVIFPKEVDKDDCNSFQHHVSTVSGKAANNDYSNKIPMKLVICKSSGRVLYAEASEKFVDILFSFLTFPLGSALHFLDGNSSVGGGCVDNLYKSMENMTENRLLTSHANELLKPNLPPHFSCLNQPLKLLEDSYQCRYYAMDCQDSKCWGPTHQVISDNAEFKCSHGVSKLQLYVRDPKSHSRVRSEFGFVKGPTTFMITDKLEVSPLSFFSALSFLSRFNLKRGDVEERIVQVGTSEVISLLRASISSNEVLNHAFNVRKVDDMGSQ